MGVLKELQDFYSGKGGFYDIETKNYIILFILF